MIIILYKIFHYLCNTETNPLDSRARSIKSGNTEMFENMSDSEIKKYMRRNATDGVAEDGGDPFAISDYIDYIRKMIDDTQEFRILTPDKTDPWEWETLVSRLDLADAITERIFLCFAIDDRLNEYRWTFALSEDFYFIRHT